jgi:hypothetical protein
MHARQEQFVLCWATRGTPIGPYDVLIAGPSQGARPHPRHAQRRRVSIGVRTPRPELGASKNRATREALTTLVKQRGR